VAKRKTWVDVLMSAPTTHGIANLAITANKQLPLAGIDAVSGKRIYFDFLSTKAI
jgi:hypothetical protein